MRQKEPPYNPLKPVTKNHASRYQYGVFPNETVETYCGKKFNVKEALHDDTREYCAICYSVANKRGLNINYHRVLAKSERIVNL